MNHIPLSQPCLFFRKKMPFLLFVLYSVIVCTIMCCWYTHDVNLLFLFFMCVFNSKAVQLLLNHDITRVKNKQACLHVYSFSSWFPKVICLFCIILFQFPQDNWRYVSLMNLLSWTPLFYSNDLSSMPEHGLYLAFLSIRDMVSWKASFQSR